MTKKFVPLNLTVPIDLRDEIREKLKRENLSALVTSFLRAAVSSESNLEVNLVKEIIRLRQEVAATESLREEVEQLRKAILSISDISNSVMRKTS
jgi:uncharacterized protein YicC (UPF0701 family)